MAEAEAGETVTEEQIEVGRDSVSEVRRLPRLCEGTQGVRPGPRCTCASPAPTSTSCRGPGCSTLRVEIGTDPIQAQAHVEHRKCNLASVSAKPLAAECQAQRHGHEVKVIAGCWKDGEA